MHEKVLDARGITRCPKRDSIWKIPATRLVLAEPSKNAIATSTFKSEKGTQKRKNVWEMGVQNLKPFLGSKNYKN